MAVPNLTKGSIIQNSWQNCYNIINTHVSDPSSRSIKWVFSAYPDTRKWPSGKDIFPIIVIDSTDISGEHIVFGDNPKNYTFSIPVSVHATRMETIDTLSDTVINTLETYRGSLETWGMNMYSVDSTPTIHSIIEGNIIHQKNINIRFEGTV